MTFDTNYFLRLLALSRQVANRCAYFFPEGSRLYVQNGKVLWDESVLSLEAKDAMGRALAGVSLTDPAFDSVF